MPCQGKTLSVRNTKGESTDGHDGGGSSGSSDEALVMSVERSGCSKTANRAIGRSDRFQRRLSSQDGRVMASRVNREVYARFCGRLEVKFLRPTRRMFWIVDDPDVGGRLPGRQLHVFQREDTVFGQLAGRHP